MDVISIVRKYIIKDLTGLVENYYIQKNDRSIGKFGCWKLQGSVNRILEEASFGGHLPLVKHAIQNGAISFTKAFTKACENGKLRIAKFLMDRSLCNIYGIKALAQRGDKKGLNSIEMDNRMIDWAIRGACLGGHFELVKSLLKRIKKNNIYCRIWIHDAYEGGDIRIVKLLETYLGEHWCDNLHIQNRLLNEACKSGNWEVINYIIDKGANDWNKGMFGACNKGHMEIVEYMISKGANDWETGLINAYEGGQLEIIKFMVGKGAIDSFSHLAELHNHVHIAQYLMEREDYFGSSMLFRCFCWNGRLDLLILYGKKFLWSPIQSGLERACRRGHFDVVKVLTYYENDMIDIEKSFIEACYGGNMEIVQLLIEKGAKNWNEGLKAACYGNLNIVKLMLEKGANNLDEGLEVSCSDIGEYPEIMDLLIGEGADITKVDEKKLCPVTRKRFQKIKKKYRSRLGWIDWCKTFIN